MTPLITTHEPPDPERQEVGGAAQVAIRKEERFASQCRNTTSCDVSRCSTEAPATEVPSFFLRKCSVWQIRTFEILFF